MNKKAIFDFASESIFWLPRIFFMIVFLIIVLSPIGCYSQNQQEQLRLVHSHETDIILNEIKLCLENGITENILNSCFTRKNVGVKISSNEVNFVVNPNRFEKELCRSVQYFCREEKAVIKVNNELKEVYIELVVRNE